MAVTTQDFKSLYTTMVAQVQGAASRLIDGTVGSILQALMQACAAQIIWLQGLVLQLLTLTRAATSTGTDLDSWMADYGLDRLPAQPAIWNGSFSRFSYADAAYLYPTQGTGGDGSLSYAPAVQTQDGSQQYAILIDTAHPAFNVHNQCYVLNPGQQLVAGIPLLALTPGAAGGGTAGGVQPLQINTLVQAMPGIDAVSNVDLRQNGADAETDAALRLRFQGYIASLSRATRTAIENAIADVAPGARCTLVENEDFSGHPLPGYFYVVVDDGSGNPTPSPAFLGSISSAIDQVRPLSVGFGVYGPTPVVTTISLTIAVVPGSDAVAAASAVQAALSAYVTGLGLGQGLYFTRLAQVAYDASPAVQNVSLVSLNGDVLDVTAVDRQRLIPWFYRITQAEPVAAGSGYAVNDVLAVQGGSQTIPATLTVTAVNDSGAITAVVVSAGGYYTVVPESPVNCSGGSGSGARVALGQASVSTITVN
jgi:uncharacterized phage protein gp47/JayE